MQTDFSFREIQKKLIACKKKKIAQETAILTLSCDQILVSKKRKYK